MKRETVGSIVAELNSKPQDEITVIDQTGENLSEYESNVWECVDRSKKDFPGNFYVVVLTKAEKALMRTLRHQFFARLSCPTPNYDQTVYYYNRQDYDLTLLWTIPSQEASHHLKLNALYVAPEEKELLNYVLSFSDGSLFKQCQKLNGEIANTPFIEGHKENVHV